MPSLPDKAGDRVGSRLVGVHGSMRYEVASGHYFPFHYHMTENVFKKKLVYFTAI